MIDRVRPSSLAQFFSPATGPFLWSISAAMGSYVVLLLTWAVSQFHPVPELASTTIVLTWICCVSMVAHVITMLLAMRANDEFWRAVIGKRVAIAALVTFGALTIWGLLTDIGLAPPFPAMFAYIAFLGVHTLLIPFINSERP